MSSGKTVDDIIREVISSANIGYTGYFTGREFSNILANKVIELYNHGYDIYSISLLLNIPETVVRRILCKKYLSDTEFEFKFRPVPKLAEEAIVQLYMHNYAFSEIIRAINKYFRIHRILVIYSDTVLKSVLIKHRVLSFGKSLVEKYLKYVVLARSHTLHEIMDKLSLSYDQVLMFAIVSEHYPLDTVRSSDEKITIPQGTPVIKKTIIDLYNKGYGEFTISSMLSLSRRYVYIVVYCAKHSCIDRLRTHVSHGHLLYRLREKIYVLSFSGLAWKNPLKKQFSNFVRKNRIYFLSKTDTIKFIYNILDEFSKTNVFKKRYFTEWLKLNGFNKDEINTIYSGWERIRNGEDPDSVIRDVADKIKRF